MTASQTSPRPVVQLNGLSFVVQGKPLYHVQINSYGGGYLSTASTSSTREYVGSMALNQAHNLIDLKEARQPYWNDAILRVVDQNRTGIDAWNRGRPAVLSCYKWDPAAGCWRYSYGTRILALDELELPLAPSAEEIEQAEMAAESACS